MIISASRRTDIPAFYSQWLFNRLREGYVLVKNPMNPHRISRVSLSPDAVDGIVFWTRNPSPMLGRLKELERYPYYFQFTLTAYGRDVEPGLPSKEEVIIPAFQTLSKAIGRHRVIWRYDPIFFSGRYTAEFHCRCFRALASRLAEHTEKCTVSFMDLYRCTVSHMKPLGIQADPPERQAELLERLSRIAGEYGIGMDACAEKTDFAQLGIPHACCIDKGLLERLGKCTLKVGKDPNQRAECGCVASIDIGAYNTCGHGCLYCYASHSRSAVQRNMAAHDPGSPLLYGVIGERDTVTERTVKSCRTG